MAVIVHPDGTEEIVKDSIPTDGGIQITVEGDVTVKILDNSTPFTDTRDHWAEDPIAFVSARGLLNGVGGGTFAPDASTTRAMMWTVLARQAGADLTGGSTWYEKARVWTMRSGISDGTNPDHSITRAQLATMLWRQMGAPEPAAPAGFLDVPQDAYYAKAVAWAAQSGITTGVGNNCFAPDALCTRAQIAMFMMRLALLNGGN